MAKAVLEHHFDCHLWCGAWCPRKNMSLLELESSKKYYRDKEKDAALYEVLKSKLARFITQKRLEEIAHGMDTNANESFNNTATWFAPKNRVYCGSRSLWNRIALAVGIVSLGIQGFYSRLFAKLGIELTDNVLYFMTAQDKVRTNRLQKRKETDSKRKRNEKKFDKLLKDTQIARKERAKRRRHLQTWNEFGWRQ